MDLAFTPEEEAYRADVRSFLETALPEALSEKVRLGRDLSKAEMEGWHATLNARGWLAPNWPKAFGGAEWSAVQRHIFDEEAAAAHAPRVVGGGEKERGPEREKFV